MTRPRRRDRWRCWSTGLPRRSRAISQTGWIGQICCWAGFVLYASSTQVIYSCFFCETVAGMVLNTCRKCFLFFFRDGRFMDTFSPRSRPGVPLAGSSYVALQALLYNLPWAKGAVSRFFGSPQVQLIGWSGLDLPKNPQERPILGSKLGRCNLDNSAMLHIQHCSKNGQFHS